VTPPSVTRCSAWRWRDGDVFIDGERLAETDVTVERAGRRG
jgi:hypothetical protein